MSYHHVTEAERKDIGRWRQDDFRVFSIARLKGRHRSTIYRELKKNSGKKGYCPKQAHEKAQARAYRGGHPRITPEMKQEIERRMRGPEQWTPEIIAQRARLEGREMVCPESIYQYVYADHKKGGDLWKRLTRSKRRRRRRCPREDGRGRGRIPNQRRINERPAVVQLRERIGDWEGDLVAGAPGTGSLLTQVDRKTRYLLVTRVGSKEAKEVSDAVIRLFSRVPAELRHTMTFDNGKEFAYHRRMEKKTRMPVYFATAYCAWERGSNENVNGLIRRLYPKGSSFAQIYDDELAFIEHFCNDRPRKCLGWRTPREALLAALPVAAA